jgi:hypothetical protein
MIGLVAFPGGTVAYRPFEVNPASVLVETNSKGDTVAEKLPLGPMTWPPFQQTSLLHVRYLKLERAFDGSLAPASTASPTAQTFCEFS